MASQGRASDDGNREGIHAIIFESRHHCLLGEASADHPNVRVAQWCVKRRDIFQITGPKSEVDSYCRWMDRVYGIRKRSPLPGGVLVITRDCCTDKRDPTAIWRLFVEYGAWDIPRFGTTRGGRHGG